MAAKFFGLAWADPLVGILGAIVVARWAIGLLKQTSSVLLDKSDTSETVFRLRELIESDTTTIEDLHLWQISENERSLILSLTSSEDKGPSFYHDLVKKVGNFEHITVEIHKQPNIRL